MRMPFVKTIDNVEIPITDKQCENLKAVLQQGAKWVDLNGAFIATHSIRGIYPESTIELTEGRLHDGTRVIRQYGRWVDAGNPSLTLSLEHYPELARDEVMSEAEWEAAQVDNSRLLEEPEKGMISTDEGLPSQKP